MPYNCKTQRKVKKENLFVEDDDNQDLFLIELDENMLAFYCKRIENDLNQGFVNDVFKNLCMTNERIEAYLFEMLDDENVLKEILLKTSQGLASSNIEAYSSFSKEDLLGNKRVTFLHLTIAYNWATFFEKLYESDNETLLDTMFAQPASTLHLAILSGNLQILRSCVQYFEQIYTSIADFMTSGMQYDTNCLFCATKFHISNSKHEICCPVTQFPIPLLVSSTGKLEILEFLVKSGICSLASLMLEYQFFYETVTPLMVTSLYGNTTIVRYLLQHNASVNYQNQAGISALHEACQGRQLEVLQTLILFGADVNVKESDGETPLFIACSNDFREIIDQLLFHTAKINVQDSQGSTPLHRSISTGHSKAAQMLIKKECDINIASMNGDTPFSLGCFQGDCGILELLLKKGVNRQHLQDGMLKACLKGYKNIISILLDHGAEINFKNNKGLSALHISCANNHSDLVTYLLSKEATPNVQSNDKQTPLYIVLQNIYL